MTNKHHHHHHHHHSHQHHHLGFMFLFALMSPPSSLLNSRINEMGKWKIQGKTNFNINIRLRGLKGPTYAICLKSWEFKDIKYDISVCKIQIGPTPNPFNWSPNTKNHSINSSFLAKLLKVAHKFYKSSLIFDAVLKSLKRMRLILNP